MKKEPSLAEQSRQSAKAVLQRQAADKESQKAVEEAKRKELEERARREEKELQRQAIRFGEDLYLLLRGDIITQEMQGFFKLATTFEKALDHELVRALLPSNQEKLASHAFNHAAKKLRADEYKVRFGRRWAGEFTLTRPATPQSEYTETRTSWSEDATLVPCGGGHPDVKRVLEEENFPKIQIEVDWSGEKENE